MVNKCGERCDSGSPQEGIPCLQVQKAESEHEAAALKQKEALGRLLHCRMVPPHMGAKRKLSSHARCLWNSVQPRRL